MRTFKIIALVLATMFIAGGAMAASFDVTNNFGIRVTEQGVCEQIGATTLSPDPATDLWAANTVITIELLGAATLCGSFSYALTSDPGAVAYTVDGTDGNDFFTVTIGAAPTVAGDTLSYGGAGSEICFDLSSTTYNSQDPNNQLVKVSYRDDSGNTYSGDIYVATVKPEPHAMALCSKSVVGDGTAFLGGADLPGWGDATDPEEIAKTGLPTEDLCFTGSVDQAQVVTDCGPLLTTTPACVTIDDPAATFDGTDYTFTFSTAKTGVGIAAVQIFNSAGAEILTDAALAAITYTYLDGTGTALVPQPVAPLTAAEAVLVKGLTIDAAAIPAGTLYAVIYLGHDTCTATAGNVNMAVTFNKIPCGDSFSASMDVFTFLDCVVGGTPTTYMAIFPYFTNTDGAWWSGMALTNLDSSAATIALTIYEEDGDMYTGTATVVANGITAGVFSGNTWGAVTFTTTGADATLGDERFRVEGTSASSFHGFGMLGDGAQGQGYLPAVTP